jgi:hypothetical protein
MATDWEAAVEERQQQGFLVNAGTQKPFKYKGRLDLLLENKLEHCLRMPPPPPLI